VRLFSRPVSGFAVEVAICYPFLSPSEAPGGIIFIACLEPKTYRFPLLVIMDGGHMQGTQRHGPDRKYNLPETSVIIRPPEIIDMI
jgi:hypothetical protein